MPSVRDILRLADRLLTDRLQLLGLARVSRGIYEFDVHGWLGLNESLRGEVRLWPFVGARNPQVDETLSHLGVAWDAPIATLQLGVSDATGGVAIVGVQRRPGVRRSDGR